MPIGAIGASSATRTDVAYQYERRGGRAAGSLGIPLSIRENALLRAMSCFGRNIQI
ncbi:hypothetical protein FIBSPDRAFT_875716, partial [Athelia psychrophila]